MRNGNLKIFSMVASSFKLSLTTRNSSVTRKLMIPIVPIKKIITGKNEDTRYLLFHAKNKNSGMESDISINSEYV